MVGRLVAELKQAPGTSAFMYADDTATTCSDGTIEEARNWAQQDADAMARWTRTWKMRLAGSKTQMLALLQRYKDQRNLHIHVDGARVDGTRHLNLFGTTLNRQLHMGEHYAHLRRKVQPRRAQLHKLTGRT